MLVMVLLCLLYNVRIDEILDLILSVKIL